MVAQRLTHQRADGQVVGAAHGLRDVPIEIGAEYVYAGGAGDRIGVELPGPAASGRRAERPLTLHGPSWICFQVPVIQVYRGADR